MFIQEYGEELPSSSQDEADTFHVMDYYSVICFTSREKDMITFFSSSSPYVHIGTACVCVRACLAYFMMIFESRSYHV